MEDKKEIKIGIITYHRAINYGAILQVYALYTQLNKMGAKPTILDYRNEKLEKIHSKKSLASCRTPKEFILYFLLHKNSNHKHYKFRKFLKEHLKCSIPMYSSEELKLHESEYDYFITGSDQVWNYEINGNDSTYFLDFVQEKNKKRSYAASFGLSSIKKEYEDKISNLLNDFEHILIREKQGANIIKELLSKECSVVLDPTMLLTKDEWKSTLLQENLKNNEKGEYILVYAFGGHTYIKNLALNISNRTGYKILWISTTYKINTSKIKYIKSAGPEEFVFLINNAKYIITNSFHGTAFSINLNKQFFTELLPESQGVNSRLEDILELFELQDRKILSSDPDIINNKIDYISVNEKLENEQSKSISLLREAIFETKR